MMPSPLAIDFQPLCAFLATQDEVVVAYLFGSVAQGRARPGSDVDLALLLSANLEPDLRADRSRKEGSMDADAVLLQRLEKLTRETEA